MEGQGTGGALNLPLPVPFNPGSRPVFVGVRLFAFFRLRNHYCATLRNFTLFLLFSAPLGILLPAPSSPPSRIPPVPFFLGRPPSCPPGERLLFIKHSFIFEW